MQEHIIDIHLMQFSSFGKTHAQDTLNTSHFSSKSEGFVIIKSFKLGDLHE